MIALTDAFAVFGIAMALCAGALSLRRFGRHKNFALSLWVKGLLLGLFIALLVPKPGANIALAAFFRGFIGDLSITLLALSFWSLCHRLFDVLPTAKGELTALLGVVAAAALLLYPTALGWGDWDVYRLGWGSWWFLSFLLVLCGLSAWMGLYVLPALVALALVAWSAGLMESSNLWDYLLDPWLSVFALGYVVTKGFIKCSQNVRRRFS
ncbi:MAG: hypothetical protein HQ446_12060 [Polaromonas sp.]|nr:hypothetical protein [Polaromonas sp.]